MAVGADTLSLEQRCRFPQLIERGVWTSQHHVVDIRVARIGVESIVHLSLFGFAVRELLARPVRTKRHVHRFGFWCRTDNVIHLDAARR